MAKTLDAIRKTARQILKDEFVSGTDYDFKPDELSIYIGEVLVEISQRRPYEVKETVQSDGTKELDISDIENLIEVEKAEYPTGSDPPDYRDVSVFGDTLRLNIDNAPTSGSNVYLYCHKVHQLTESSSTLNPVLEKVVVEGTVAKAAMAWLNKMREQIVPSSVKWYHEWAAQHFAIYQASLNSITKQRVWNFYSRD